MMRSEFIERTGFEPMREEYSEIESAYLIFDGDKDAFCEHWKKSGEMWRMINGRARRIEELNDMISDRDRQIRALNARIVELDACANVLKEDNLEQMRKIDRMAARRDEVLAEAERLTWLINAIK